MFFKDFFIIIVDPYFKDIIEGIESLLLNLFYLYITILVK